MGQILLRFYDADKTTVLASVAELDTMGDKRLVDIGPKMSDTEYTKFVGWEDADGVLHQTLFETPYPHDLKNIWNLYARYEYTKFYVRFWNDTALLKEQWVDSGEDATPPDDSEAPPGYIFKSWRGNYTNVTKPENVYAVLERAYEVVFKDWDGAILESVKVGEGETAPAPEVFRNGYAVQGWSQDISNVHADMIVEPVYLDESELIKQAILTGQRRELILDFGNSDIITLTNEDLVAESLEITSSLAESSSLVLGKCNAKEFKIQTFRVTQKYKGKKFKAKLVFPDVNQTLKLGEYTVYKETFNDDRTVKSLVAYDYIYKLRNKNIGKQLRAYTKEGNYTIRQLRNYIMSLYSIPVQLVALPLDNMIVNPIKQPGAIYALDVLEDICELNGCFGSSDVSGRFKFVFLGKRNNMVHHSITDSSFYSATKEDYKTAKITNIEIERFDKHSVTVRATDDDKNIYSIKGNILTTGKSEGDLSLFANDILEELSDFRYEPFKANLPAMPWVNAGDTISIKTRNTTVTSVILCRVISGILGIQDTFSASGTEEIAERTKTSTEKQEERGDDDKDDSQDQIDEIKNEMFDVKSVPELPSDAGQHPKTIYLIQGTVG